MTEHSWHFHCLSRKKGAILNPVIPITFKKIFLDYGVPLRKAREEDTLFGLEEGVGGLEQLLLHLTQSHCTLRK